MRKEKTKVKNVIILLVWILLLILIPFFISMVEDNQYKNNISYISSDFEIEEYNVILEVDKDRKIDVTEKITINIPSGEFNGIYKSIPLWQKYYDQNGKEQNKKIAITNLRAIGEKYVLNESSNNIGIRIGSTHTNASAGLHTYTIKYRYNMGKDVNGGFDDFIFNVFENYDNTKINNVTITLNMFENIDIQTIKFLKGNGDISNRVNYELSGKTLSASLDDYLLDESLTIKMLLPDGYFVGGTNNYGIKSLLICISIIIITMGSFFTWIKFGKDYDKYSKTVEFYPPEDLDAAQVGYIYGEKSIKKLTTALIIGLASKGYISIEQVENEKYRIVNIGNSKDKTNKMSITEQLVYQELFKNGDINNLSQDMSFPNVFQKVFSCLESTVDKKIYDPTSRKRMNITLILLIVSVATWLVSYLYINDLNPKYEILYLLSFIAIFITGFFSIFMDRKTTYGEMIIAKILGFRDYLYTAEKNQINALVEENPNYFYDLLPYTYVLNISKKWIETFEKTNVPNLDISLLDCYEDNLFMIMSE